MLGYLRKTVGIFGEGMKAFAGIKAGDSVGAGTGKVALIVIKRTIYTFADYWLAALCAAANIALKAWGLSLWCLLCYFLKLYRRASGCISIGQGTTW